MLLHPSVVVASTTTDDGTEAESAGLPSTRRHRGNHPGQPSEGLGPQSTFSIGAAVFSVITPLLRIAVTLLSLPLFEAVGALLRGTLTCFDNTRFGAYLGERQLLPFPRQFHFYFVLRCPRAGGSSERRDRVRKDDAGAPVRA